jgi:hypothetical protein
MGCQRALSRLNLSKSGDCGHGANSGTEAMAPLRPIPAKGNDAERAREIARFLKQSQLPVIRDLQPDRPQPLR